MKLTTFRIEKMLGATRVELYPTLIQVNGKNYLVDCGYEETFEEFVSALEVLGIGVGDLYAIIISHDDIDHLGAVHLFKSRNTNLLLYSSAIEEPSVSGRIPSERLVQAESALADMPEASKSWAMAFIQQLQSIRRLQVDRTVQDKDRIEEDLIVVHTPGHTKGHLSLFIPSQGTVIANDAVVIEEGELNIANPEYTLDLAQALRSVEKIRDLGPGKLICYHGGIMEEKVAEKLNQLIRTYTSPAAP